MQVIVNTAAANRDPAVYDDPDRLNITCEWPATMLTFGGGIHYCLGAHLARAEFAQALTAITRRTSDGVVTGDTERLLTGFQGRNSKITTVTVT
jgi:cytochrome P450